MKDKDQYDEESELSNLPYRTYFQPGRHTETFMGTVPYNNLPGKILILNSFSYWTNLVSTTTNFRWFEYDLSNWECARQKERNRSPPSRRKIGLLS